MTTFSLVNSKPAKQTDPMSSSYICPNCGIKVSSAEESGCPGCGHLRSDSQDVSESTGLNSNEIFAENPLKKNSFGGTPSEIEFAIDFLRQQVDDRKDDFLNNPKKTMLETEAKCLACIENAPNEESKNVLYAYLGHLYDQMGRFKLALEAGLIGVKCKDPFFRNQGYDSIFHAFHELKINDEFKVWLERAKDDNYPSLTYWEIQYFINTEELQKALDKCDEYASKHPEWAISTRANIYQEFGLMDEAEAIFRKLTSKRVSTPFYANYANSLAYSVLMPQNRFAEAEEVLVKALATDDVRERVNAYSNLAMVAFGLKEYSAASRYAAVGAGSHDQSIASESRLTLCRIENQKLLEDVSTPETKWDELFVRISKELEITDFDDCAAYFKLLISSAERSSRRSDIVAIIEEQYGALKENIEWIHDLKAQGEIEKIRLERVSELLLQGEKYLELETLYSAAFAYLNKQSYPTLLHYLQKPIASTNFRERCLDIADVDFLTEWARFEASSEILLKLSNNKTESILLSIAANPAASDQVLKIILVEGDLDLDFAVITREPLSPELVHILISSPFVAVRREIAARSDLDYKDYETLATDSSLLVRDTIKENPDCPVEIKALAALGSL